MDAGWVALILAEIALIWFAVKTYIDLRDVVGENRRLKEKIEELKEWIRNAK